VVHQQGRDDRLLRQRHLPGCDGLRLDQRLCRRPLLQPDLCPGLGRRPGQGKVLLADRGFDVNSYDLDDGNLTIRANNLMGFAPTLDLKQSIIRFVVLMGTGKFLASSNGPVIFVEPPFRSDPEALLGWADCPSPAVHHDTQWMASSMAGMLQGAMGRVSGEERQYEFTGTGTVLLQSSEVMREDPAVLRLIESQTMQLSNPQALQLASKLQARAQQQ
jgi:hypothetical protein